MPTTARSPNPQPDRGRDSPWITAASLFVGQPLDKRAAIGAYTAAAATLVVSVIILLVTRA